MCSNITNIQNKTDPIQVLQGIYGGMNVYANFTGNTPCFDISSDTPDSINAIAWEYQVNFYQNV